MGKLRWMAVFLLLGACKSGEKREQENTPASCGKAGNYPGYTGSRTWNIADFESCDALCPELESEACVREKCPGANAFFGCIDEEIYACQTARGGDCRPKYEAYACCAESHCSAADSTTAHVCLADSCTAENNAVEDCYYPATPTQGFEACVDTAYSKCLGDEPACVRENADPLAGYVGTSTWTRAWSHEELEACATSCAEATSLPTCMEDTCPGASQYRVCVQEELASCSTEPEGSCREAWENVYCCARAQCAGLAGSTFSLCLTTSCDTQLERFTTCAEAEPSGTCSTRAAASCTALKDTDDAGTDDAGTDDAGTDDAGTDDAGTDDAADAGIEPLDAGTNDNLDGSVIDDAAIDGGVTETVVLRLLQTNGNANRAKLHGPRRNSVVRLRSALR